jgi:hypothetical protein
LCTYTNSAIPTYSDNHKLRNSVSMDIVPGSYVDDFGFFFADEINPLKVR